MLEMMSSNVKRSSVFSGCPLVGVGDASAIERRPDTGIHIAHCHYGK
jgi:hypothetical protein